MNGAPPTLQYSYETAAGVGGAQTNPLPAGKQDASALFAHLNGSGPVTTPAQETVEPIAVSAVLPPLLHKRSLTIKLPREQQKVAVTNGL